MSRVLVISPGVLPLPPVLGGAVENLIARLHPGLADHYLMEYVAVRPTSEAADWDGAEFHYIDSVNPLIDFTPDNHFELHESERWGEYRKFCINVARDRHPQIVHVHNEAYLISDVRDAVPDARHLLHVNDEVVTRMSAEQLRQLASKCDRILACSNYIGSQVRNAFEAAKTTPPPIDTYYNFVDVGEYDPASIRPDRVAELRRRHELGDGPVVMFVGRLIEQKGPHLALRAFRRAAGGHPDARLLFVGAPWYSRPTDSPFVDTLRREAVGIEERIRFTGYVEHASMPDYYALADIVCAPSIWDDPSPFVTYEAQAMGRPVLASNRGGIPEIVADHETGRCIDVFNTPLFAQILDDWLRDPGQRRTLGSRGRSRVCDRFSLEKARLLMRSIYEELAPSC